MWGLSETGLPASLMLPTGLWAIGETGGGENFPPHGSGAWACPCPLVTLARASGKLGLYALPQLRAQAGASVPRGLVLRARQRDSCPTGHF